MFPPGTLNITLQKAILFLPLCKISIFLFGDLIYHNNSLSHFMLMRINLCFFIITIVYFVLSVFEQIIGNMSYFSFVFQDAKLNIL